MRFLSCLLVNLWLNAHTTAQHQQTDTLDAPHRYATVFNNVTYKEKQGGNGERGAVTVI